MSYETVGKLFDKWINDPAFRESVRRKPEETVKKMGVSLTKDEWDAFRKVDWNASDEELKSRISGVC